MANGKGRPFHTREQDEEFVKGFTSGSPGFEGGNFVEFLKNGIGWIDQNIATPIADALTRERPPGPEPYSGMENILGDRAESRAQGGAVEGLGDQRVSKQQFQEFWQGLSDEDKQFIDTLERNQPEVSRKLEERLDAGDYAAVVRYIRTLL